MMSIGTMLRERRAELNMRQTDFCQRLGITQSTYSSWEDGRAIPGTKFAAVLSKALQMPVTQVLNLIVAQRKAQSMAVRNLGRTNLIKTLRLPILGEASAGVPVDKPPLDNGVVGDYFRGLPGEGFGVIVDGDSMVGMNSPKAIMPGSLCVCASADGIPPQRLVGKVVCARLEGDEHLIKELVLFNGTFYLKSWNTTYPMLIVNSPSAAIEGFVVMVLRRFD